MLRPLSSSTPLRRHALTVAVLTAAFGGSLLQPAFAQSGGTTAQHALSIPAKPLPAALADFTSQTGVQVVVPSGLPSGVNAQAVDGRQSATEALGKLLAGTGLTWRVVDNSTIALEQAPVGSGDVQVTDAVRIVGGGGGVGGNVVSEGTRSYTTPQANTATRLGLSLRETPQSVTVVTRQQIEDMGAQTMTDILEQTTGIAVSITDTERVNYMSRGYSISTYQVDGINNAFSNGYTRVISDPAIYDRIEVLRGAGGLTLGAGDPGGTINQVRKRPTNEFAASVGLATGRWNSHRLEFDIGGALALDGRIRGRAVAVKQTSDSFRDWYTSDKEIFFGTLEGDLTEKTLLTVGYTYQKPENSGVTWGTIPYWLSDGSLANLPSSFNTAARWSQWATMQKQWFARVEHAFNEDWNLKLSFTKDDQKVYGHRWFGGNGYFPNPDGTGKSAWWGGGDNYATDRTWDAQLGGAFALFGRRHEINVGYTNAEGENHTPAASDILPADFFTVIPDWRNWDGKVPQYQIKYEDYDSSYSQYKQSAVYFAARINIADPVKAIIGGRYGDWEKYSFTRNDTTGNYARTGYGIEDVFTPYAALQVDVGEYLTAYASFTDIFTPQNARDYRGEYIDPIEGNHYEVGLKGEFFDGGLNASIAAFRSKKDNLAEIDDDGRLEDGSFDPLNPPEGYNPAGYRFIPGTSELAYRSTGKGNRINGYELEVQGDISANWSVAGGYTRVDMEDKNGAAITTYLPSKLLRLRTNYRFGGALEKLSIGGGVTWQSETWANVNSVPTGQVNPVTGRAITESRRIVQPSVYLLNLSAHYQFSEQLSLNFNVNNLLDKEYYNRVGFYSGVTWGTPRDYRLSLRYRF